MTVAPPHQEWAAETQEDAVRRWLAERCRDDPKWSEHMATLYADFISWCGITKRSCCLTNGHFARILRRVRPGRYRRVTLSRVRFTEAFGIRLEPMP